MADRDTDILLIGGGIASAMAAATLREEGFDGSILLAGRELDPPYHRPPASKGYLRGSESKDDALVHPSGWWDEQGVELLTRTSVMAPRHRPRAPRSCRRKEEVGYGQALVATGAMVRRLSVDGAQLDGIHYLRALGNADTIRGDVDGAEHVVCVGGSYIGSRGRRVADRARQARHDRDAGGRAARAPVRRPRRRVLPLGPRGARDRDRERRRDRALRERLGRPRATASASRASSPPAAARSTAGAVVCGVGAQPDVMLARRAGLTLGDLGGVRCDSRLRTSAERVFAAGDICEYDSVVHGRVVRIEHEEVAAAQGATAARNMLGADAPHDVVPYFFSDLSDWAVARVRRARGGRGTRRSSAATSTAARSRSGTSRAAASGRCSPSAARATSSARTS